MTLTAPDRDASSTAEAKRRFLASGREPLFYGDWKRAVFLHFAVDGDLLQRAVPFPVDRFQGEAIVSLVAFTMDRFRPHRGGKFGEWLFRPVRCHHFLNVRTYVTERNEPGIYFIREWISHRLLVPCGRPTFGLPYHYARIRYDHARSEAFSGSVSPAGGDLAYHGAVEDGAALESANSGTCDDFLLERYTAYTAHGSVRRRFRIFHEPWLRQRAIVHLDETRLLSRFNWFAGCRPIGAHFSPGVHDVWMGFPRALNR